MNGFARFAALVAALMIFQLLVAKDREHYVDRAGAALHDFRALNHGCG